MSRAPVVFIAGLLLGGAGAVIVAHVARDGAPPAAVDADLARRLDALDASLRALRTTIADQPAPLPARADVAPAPLTDTRIDEILVRLEALQQQVDKLPPASVADSAELDAAAGPKPRAVEPLPDKLPDEPPNLAAFAALTGRDMDELTQQFQLWTYEQVGAAYGRPTFVKPSPNGIGIKYRYVLADGREFYFWFSDGKVIGAFWN